VDSNSGEFWDTRYRAEGAIWGESPSPTAQVAAQHLTTRARLLEIGFGYGRDLPFYIRQGCRVTAIDLSITGRQLAEQRLQREGLQAESLLAGRFEQREFVEPFDVVVSHRMAHLLVDPAEMASFSAKVLQVLRPGGMLCLGARNLHDLDQATMVSLGDGVYEYTQRPGHRIRYWDHEAFRRTFNGAFDVCSLIETTELESQGHPVPCHLTVMVGQKRPTHTG
jgi:2-polyprenyl-3-methyl-5-hydroxy-6-metoxy-1,4-benzoquinol methylase